MFELTKLGTVPGYLSDPIGDAPWPGLIVIQEWWGLDMQTISIADRFAAAGYLAFAPDLFHGELAQLGDGQTASELTQKYGPGAPEELQEVYDALINQSDCTGKVGSVGFCFGDEDVSIPTGTIEQFDKLLDQVGVEHEVIVYPNAGHAFFRDRDPNAYRPEAAKDAWERATKFFAKNLR
jgi:carboxymethylenebutenolidase